MAFIIVALVALIFVIIYQVAKASEFATILKGEEKVQEQTNRLMGWLLLAFCILGIYGLWKCHVYLMPMMLPEAASEAGVHYDSMLYVTLILTGIVFFATQILLFFFAWKYQHSKTRASFYYAHSNKLEIVWTVIPAIVMAALVAIGLKNWFAVTSDAPADAQVVEVIGKQFNWVMRYPGPDGELGKRNFRLTDDGYNILGQDFANDPKNLDDIINASGELHIVKGKPVKLIIGSRDVIHDVGLPHFRYKMDAVPGITTTIWMTPTISTEEMKQKTGNPNFVYEISCDQMCGKGHYSMRGIVIVHQTQAELDKWLSEQPAYYAGTPEGMKNAPPPPAEAAPVKDSTSAAPIAANSTN